MDPWTTIWTTVAAAAIVGFGTWLFKRLGRRKPSPVDGKVWTVQRLSDHRYRLRNTGPTTAHDVRVEVRGFPENLTKNVPDGVELAAGESHDFMVVATWQKLPPGEVWVTWDGGGPVAVELPTTNQ